MKDSDSTVFSSNAVRLARGEWAVCLGLLLALLLALPSLWPRWERLETSPSFRIPYELSEDYWLYGHWVREAARRYPVLMVGDSVVWGEYVDAVDTIPRCLNNLLGEEVCGNIGLNGLHPAACLGLLAHYAKPVAGRGVIVNLNPLWLHAPNVDLTGKEAFRFQHPGLVPQFRPRLACYEADRGERIGRVAARCLPFVAFLKHVKTLYFDNLDVKGWLAEHPAKNPFASRRLLDGYIAGSAGAHSRPVSWVKKRMQMQNYPWVDLDESFQWRSFRDAIELLRERGNRVFVLLGPFNPHMMEAESLERYRARREAIERWFDDNGVPYYRAPDVASELFADASHTTKAGYVEIATGLLAHEPFRKWLADGRCAVRPPDAGPPASDASPARQ